MCIEKLISRVIKITLDAMARKIFEVDESVLSQTVKVTQEG